MGRGRDRREPLARALATAIEALLLAIVAVAALAFGGVTLRARLACEIGVAILLLFSAAREWLCPVPSDRRLALRASLPLVLLAGLAFAQTISLPRSIVARLAPGRERFEREIRPESDGASTGAISVDPAGTRSEALWLIAVAGFLYAGVRAAGRPGAARRMTLGLASIAAGIAAVGIAQKLAGNGLLLWSVPEPPNSKPFGPFVNRNHFAGLMELGLAAALASLLVESLRFAERTDGSSGRARLASFGDRAAAPLVLSGALVFVVLAGVLLSQSRAGIAGAAAVALVAVVAALLVAGSKRAAVAIVLGGAAAAAGVVAWIGPSVVLERFGDVPSEHARLGVWSDCLKLAKDAPVAGTGLGTFAAIYPAHQTVPVILRFAHAESDWWQLLVEGGVLALAALAIGIPLAAGAVARRFREARPTARLRLLCVGAGVVALLAHGFVDVNLHVPSNALAFSLALGVILGDAPGRDERRSAEA
jgi:O-antigen ligase